MKYLQLALAGLVLSGCASTQDLREGPPNVLGGFIDDQIAPGLYEMTATGSVAKGTWNRRADHLCGAGKHQGLLVTPRRDFFSPRDTYTPLGIMSVRPYRDSLNGYVLCNSSPMDVEQALKFISSRSKPAVKE